MAKAATLVPAIERTGTWQMWVDLSRQLSAPVLQERVSVALQSAPRGHELSPPGDRFRRAVLSAMPDIEAMELVERFFEVGATMAGTPIPLVKRSQGGGDADPDQLVALCRRFTALGTGRFRFEVVTRRAEGGRRSPRASRGAHRSRRAWRAPTRGAPPQGGEPEVARTARGVKG